MHLKVDATSTSKQDRFKNPRDFVKIEQLKQRSSSIAATNKSYTKWCQNIAEYSFRKTSDHPYSNVEATDADIPFLDQIAHAPHLFQRCIQKECDLRITVVGEELFCVRIESQSGQGTVDWRNDYTVEMLQHSNCRTQSGQPMPRTHSSPWLKLWCDTFCFIARW